MASGIIEAMPPRQRKSPEERAVRRARSRRIAEDAEATVTAMSDYVPDTAVRGGTVPRPGSKDESVDRRSQKKITLGKRWTQIIREVEKGEYTWDDFVRTLDAEELARGQLKSEAGNFAGRPPNIVPRAFYLQCVREIRRRFDEKMQQRLLDATDELIDLSREGGGLHAKDRAKILQYLIERVMGPVPREVTIKAEQPWEDLVVGVFGQAPEGMKAPGEDRYEEGVEGDED